MPSPVAPPPGEFEVVTRISRAAEATQAAKQTAEYWTGHTYQVDGIQHYTGFAYFPGRDETGTAAVLGQVTYLASSRRDRSPWREVVVQPDIGKAGWRGRAYGVDPQRPIVDEPASDGRLLVAVPVDGAIEQGVVPKLYEVLVRTGDARWHYAGSVHAGSDDGAGCDDGRAYPCRPVRGDISFVQGTVGLPDILVTFGNENPGYPSRERYRYDPGSQQYRESQ